MYSEILNSSMKNARNDMIQYDQRWYRFKFHDFCRGVVSKCWWKILFASSFILHHVFCNEIFAHCPSNLKLQQILLIRSFPSNCLQFLSGKLAGAARHRRWNSLFICFPREEAESSWPGSGRKYNRVRNRSRGERERERARAILFKMGMYQIRVRATASSLCFAIPPFSLSLSLSLFLTVSLYSTFLSFSLALSLSTYYL